jgi:hypothetical protein
MVPHAMYVASCLDVSGERGLLGAEMKEGNCGVSIERGLSSGEGGSWDS